MTNELENEMARGAPEQVTDEQMIEIAGAAQGPSFTVAEVTDRVPIGQERVRQRLMQLEAAGVIQKKKISGTNIFWFTDDA